MNYSQVGRDAEPGEDEQIFAALQADQIVVRCLCRCGWRYERRLAAAIPQEHEIADRKDIADQLRKLAEEIEQAGQ